MNRSSRCALVVLGLWITCSAIAGTTNPYVGRWALTLPNGAAGWLGVTEEAGKLAGSILWGSGSVVPVNDVKLNGDKLIITRIQESRRRDDKGQPAKSIETITATLDGDTLKLTTVTRRADGSETAPGNLTGKRIPALSARPELAKIKYGKPIVLLNGRNLDGWKLVESRATSGWSVENGILVNKPVKQEGGPRVSYGNLRTVAEFEDFNLKLEVNVAKGDNSGVYLRGIYEVQVSDSYGGKLDSHNMGGIYSRISPTVNAEKPAGQWQTLDMTLVERHVTIILNGKTIIDNQPLLGCTGGALWSDELKPGPIYFQGDHTGISYRNIVLTPIVK